MRQYEIWWADLPGPIGRRPVLLLSRDAAFGYLTRVIVVEVTTVVRNIPVEVPLGRAEGLPRRSVANFDNLHVVPRARLSARIGFVGASRVGELKRALGSALGWQELKEIQPE
ncbi:MAG TPA: type II toxin-antitoxin system PemK/MazF family toxin [Vicinamibacteria bacterium]|nr:type II toxin-antitoxin system PemK/MazF family toxin [Vicinamibacteria bacterium]